MSKYGDERMHMEDWQDQLKDRAEEVGPQQAMGEMLKVLQDFTDMYWTEKAEARTASCQHPINSLMVNMITKRTECSACGHMLTEEELAEFRSA